MTAYAVSVRHVLLARLAPTVVLEDVTVPRSALAQMVDHVQVVGQRHGVKVGTFGHMGDGNLHPTFLCDKRDEEEMAPSMILTDSSPQGSRPPAHREPGCERHCAESAPSSS